MTMIFITGGPCTGRTTTTNMLYAYLTKHMPEMKVAIIQKDPVTFRYSETDAAWAAYRHIVEKSADIIICDGVGNNVFTRKAIMNAITDATKISEVDVVYLAIEHRRTDSFMFEHNGDDNHVPYTTKKLRENLNITQPPIHAEGINVIYRVGKTGYCDPAAACKMFNEYGGMSFKFPIVTKLTDVTEETKEICSNDV